MSFSKEENFDNILIMNKINVAKNICKLCYLYVLFEYFGPNITIIINCENLYTSSFYPSCLNLRKGLKNSDDYHFGGVSKGQLSLFIFFVPNVIKFISRHESIGVGGSLEGTSCPPLVLCKH